MGKNLENKINWCKKNPKMGGFGEETINDMEKIVLLFYWKFGLLRLSV
jgi:hypothetical protein